MAGGISMQSALRKLHERGGRAYRLRDSCNHVVVLLQGMYWWVDDDGLVYVFRPGVDDVMTSDWVWEAPA